MRTKRLKIYKFEELNKDAKQKAIEAWRQKNYQYGDYAWRNQINDSYKDAKKLVYDRLNNIESEIKGMRLYKWIQNNLSSLWIKPNFISNHIDGTFNNSDWKYKYDCVAFRKSKISFTNNIENCCFTGFCSDIDFLQPVIDFLNKPDFTTSNIDLYNSMPSLEKMHNENADEQNTDEYIIDMIISNEYEFLNDGTRYL